MDARRPLIWILGSGGHARVLADMIDGPCVMTDKNDASGQVVIGVGDLKLRVKLYDQFMSQVLTLVHKTAFIAKSATIGPGAQIMAGAVIQANAMIGANTIINTRASIDHDCIVGNHCHIAPGATVCGGVMIGDGSFVGAGATIVQGVTLGAGAFIPAGALVVGPGDIRRPVRLVRDMGANQTPHAA